MKKIEWLDMEKIKFRGWFQGINGVEEWVYGYLVKQTNGNWEITNGETSWTVDNVGEFTGLKDKNDREIYEGDILKFVGGTCEILPYGHYDGHHIKGTILCVQKLLSGFTLCLPRHYENDTPNIVGKIDNYKFWNHQRSFEVIGNIYENSELLNKED